MALSWRFRRKFQYILLVMVLPVFLLGRFFYFHITKEPTCFDGKQNGLEISVDCGGECRLLCSNQVVGLGELWERHFFVADDVYNLVAYIENPNVNAGIPSIRYEFIAFDGQGNQIGQPFVGSTFIGPSERTMIFVPGFVSGDQKVDRISFRFISPPSWQKTDPFFSTLFLRGRLRDIKNVDSLPQLSISLENKSFFNFTDVPVIVILYDIDGNAIAVSQTIVPKVLNTSEQELFFTWPKPFDRPVVDVEIIPRIDPFRDLE